MCITNTTGNVGIGTTDPATATGGRVLHINNSTGPAVLRLGDGEVNRAQWELQSTVFNGTGALNFSNISAFTNPMQLFGNGNLNVTGNVCAANIFCPSDARLKEDIHPLRHSLESLGSLRGVGYEWRRQEYPERDFPTGPQIGLIAQEVQKVAPQAVVRGADGYLAVDYSRLTPILVEAIKAQQSTIDRLTARLDELEKQMKAQTSPR